MPRDVRIEKPPDRHRVNPPGPAFRFTAPPILRMGRDRLGYLTELARTYGDVAYVRIGVERLYLVSHPELIREVLVTHSRNFEKGRGLDRVKRLLGEGLLTSEGEHHLRQRRMIQPVFHHQRIAGWARTMSERAVQHTAAWRDGEERDIVAEMTRLTLAIVGDTLFGVDVGSEAAEISRALTSLMESFYMMMLPFPGLIERLPLPKVRRMRAARDHLDGVIFRLIDERRKSGAQGDDLLSMLLAAQDTEGDGTGMSNEQVRDEALTIFLAGHETTANALSWTWWLLGQHPDVERRLHEELERVLAGRAPGAADYGALTYTEQIVTESMRL